MGTEVLKSFGTLQSELEQARDYLKNVDESIKRLIGRDPSELNPRLGIKRAPPIDDVRPRQRGVGSTRNKSFNHENEESTPSKRRNISVFQRLSDRPNHYEEEGPQQPYKQMISKVIVTPREVPSRQEALAKQNKDEKSKARNRRMFGALLGTLQKFQQEETKLKVKEEKRAQVEKKIEEHEIKEKAEIKKERQELFLNRKKKQAEIKMIEMKMTRMKNLAAWEERQKPLINFIQTKSKPHIHYLPRKLNDVNKTLLESCKSEMERMIEKKRHTVSSELKAIEKRMKKNFEARFRDRKHADIDSTVKDDSNEEIPLDNSALMENGISHMENENKVIHDSMENVEEGGCKINEGNLEESVGVSETSNELEHEISSQSDNLLIKTNKDIGNISDGESTNAETLSVF